MPVILVDKHLQHRSRRLGAWFQPEQTPELVRALGDAVLNVRLERADAARLLGQAQRFLAGAQAPHSLAFGDVAETRRNHAGQELDDGLVRLREGVPLARLQLEGANRRTTPQHGGDDHRADTEPAGQRGVDPLVVLGIARDQRLRLQDAAARQRDPHG